eukprot:11155865-Lingulodinium_polyedra.AAC.1
MGHDPIVRATQDPTYVDDLSGLTAGAEQTSRLLFFLLAAGHAAGLSTTTRCCVTVSARAVHPRVDAALGRFP